MPAPIKSITKPAFGRHGELAKSSPPNPLAHPLRRFLAPGALDDAATRAVKAFHHEGDSAHTRRSYAQAYRYWGAWYALRYGQELALPVPAPVVVQFLVDHLSHGEEGRPKHLLPVHVDRELIRRGYKARPGELSLNTVEQRVAALSSAHQKLLAQRGLAPEGFNPVRSEAVRQLLSAIRRAYVKRGKRPRKPTAATREPLEAMLATCDVSLQGRRDRALLLFGFASGGRRRSEITAATFERLQPTADGFLYELGHSKTHRSGRPDPNDAKPVVGVAAEALKAWLDELARAGIRDGPIFRRLTNARIGEGLAPAAVRDIVRRRARLARLGSGFAAHSLRSGFVTEAARQKVSLPETMALTGHKSVATVLQYFQAGAAATSAAATLLDRPAPPRESPPEKPRPDDIP